MMAYYELALAGVHTGNRYYTYESDVSLESGAVVNVPFGNQTTQSIVMKEVKKPTFKVKKIELFTGTKLPKEFFDLMVWMHSFYVDDQGSINNLFLPKKTKKMVDIDPEAGKGEALPRPTYEQKIALESLSDRIVLHGETGSGKTRVFIEKAIETIEKKQSVIILTPEIGLTSQLYLDFKKHVKSPIIVNHSDLSDKERNSIWHYAAKGLPSVYIGPRSTLFLPIHNIGLLVLDEAHDSSYKQNQPPKYNSLNVATKLAGLHNSKLIYSTATPNIDDYYKFSLNNYALIRLSKTIGDKPHSLKIVDQNKKKLFGKSNLLSDKLIDAVNEALGKKQQSLIFLNRRGSARLVQCTTCGYVFECPNCGIPFVYHQDTNKLACHTCNYKISNPKQCPTCKGVEILYSVPGTKSLFAQIQNIFPSAKIARFDTDLLKKDRLSIKYEQIKKGEIDIIIGTQIISKGLDLPNLAVVGVVNADNGLNIPDYRAEEVSFQQLYQVTGRATRGFIPAKSIIQTRSPKHPIIKSLVKRSWIDFYNYELEKRKMFNYPPYSYLAIIKNKAKSAKSAEQSSRKIAGQISLKGIQILGPSPAFIEKQGGYYVYQLLLKSKKRSLLNDAISSLKGNFSFDIDPSSLL